MEYSCQVSFTVTEPTYTQLKSVFDGIDQGEIGALMEECFDTFGEVVSDEVANMLELYGSEAFTMEEYSFENDQFRICFNGDCGFTEHMLYLLKLCGVTAAKGREDADEYVQNLLLKEDGSIEAWEPDGKASDYNDWIDF